MKNTQNEIKNTMKNTKNTVLHLYTAKTVSGKVYYFLSIKSRDKFKGNNGLKHKDITYSRETIQLTDPESTPYIVKPSRLLKFGSKDYTNKNNKNNNSNNPRRVSKVSGVNRVSNIDEPLMGKSVQLPDYVNEEKYNTDGPGFIPPMRSHYGCLGTVIEDNDDTVRVQVTSDVPFSRNKYAWKKEDIIVIDDTHGEYIKIEDMIS